MATDILKDKLKLVSYNCKHFRNNGPKFEFMKQVMKDNDIFLVQEHCLFESHLIKLRDLGNEIELIGKSSMDENVSLEGRPYGGCAILYKSSINKCVINEVKCQNQRLCGINIILDRFSILILNMYMPCDTNRQDDNLTSYMEVLSEIEQIIHRVNPNRVIMGGDMNTDLSRNSYQVIALTEFLEAHSMLACIDLDTSNVPYTFIGPSSNSRIDHFLISNGLVDCIERCAIIDEHLYSDHVPLRIVFNIEVEYLNVSERPHVCKIAWHKATDDHLSEYRHNLNNNLRTIDVHNEVFTCTNVNCTQHIEVLYDLYKSVIQACVSSSECIPVCGSSGSGNEAMPKGCRCLAGWSEVVEPLRQESLSWHHLWKSWGQPHLGDIAEMHRISRARYHRAVRNVIRESDKIRMEKMAEAILGNKSRLFWSEVNKIKGRNNVQSGIVDGCTGECDIAEVFSNKYNNLYNSVPYDEHEMCLIREEISNRIALMNNADYKIEVRDVLSAVNRLKRGKADGEEGLNSDSIINGPHILYVYLSLILRSMIVHGVSPDSLISGTMVAIPKGKRNDLCCSDNYRAITLGSIIGKVLDLVILAKEGNSLNSSNLQFGFKEHMSTSHCTFTKLEVISHYNANRSDVYVMMLDATKAFDRVNYCKLFRKLLDRDMSPLVLRLLLYMYTNQKLQIRWGASVSEKFKATNGVKQGGVLSPILFSVYVDDLFKRLEESGAGCWVSNHFVGCVAYADDLSLIAPSRKGLQTLIDTCEKYAVEHDVQFNGQKSQFMVFGGRECKRRNNRLFVGNNIVEESNNGIHLGHKLSTIDRDYMTSSAIGQFWKSFNIFRADFGHIRPFLQCKLFKQYCCSFYGAPLWDLNSSVVKKVCVAWRKALRKLWRLPARTHCDIVALVSDCIPLDFSLEKILKILRYNS